MVKLPLVFEECGILPPKFDANHNHSPKPKPNPNKWKQTKLIKQLQNYNLPIIEELQPSENYRKYKNSF